MIGNWKVEVAKRKEKRGQENMRKRVWSITIKLI